MLAPAPDPAPLSITALPHDVMLDVCELLTDPHDQAALCLADPRLGLAALRRLPSFQGPLTSIALALWSRRARVVLGEALLRRYAADRRATAEGAAWLKAAAECERWPLHLSVTRNLGQYLWCLHGQVKPFEGEEGAERLVRVVWPDGQVQHFEGEKNPARLVRGVWPDGQIQHYEGEAGAERKVRVVWPSGEVWHFEGERGAERKVRVVWPSGVVWHYEGEKGAERMVSRFLRVLFGIVKHSKAW